MPQTVSFVNSILLDSQQIQMVLEGRSELTVPDRGAGSPESAPTGRPDRWAALLQSTGIAKLRSLPQFDTKGKTVSPTNTSGRDAPCTALCASPVLPRLTPKLTSPAGRLVSIHVQMRVQEEAQRY